MAPWVPTCVECGVDDNPCRCKVVGPSLALLLMLAVAVLAWPIGAMLYLCDRSKGRRLMAHPVSVVYPSVNHLIPF